jgi:predicted nicotinamide N-methyase
LPLRTTPVQIKTMSNNSLPEPLNQSKKKSQNEPQTGPQAESTLKYIPSWHYDMLVNQGRSQFYSDLIKDNCRDKVVLEIGTGSGLLAALAVKYGARKVVCCEENPLLALAAQSLFRRLRIEEKIQLIQKNSKDIATEEIPAADVILHELFGSDPFSEEMIPTLSDARRFLKPNGIFLPEKIQIVYHPIRNHHLPEKIFFEDIELIEMSLLISEIHPSLRARSPNGPGDDLYFLPEISIHELLKAPYSYLDTNNELNGVDAIELSYLIIHGEHKFQAAAFEAPTSRVHCFRWFFTN